MDIMATLKVMPNLLSLELAYHSSYEVKLEKDMLPWIYRAIITTQIPVFRISATLKCMQVDGTRILALVNTLDNHLDCRGSHLPIRYAAPATRFVYEWTATAEDQGLFYIEAAKPNAEYQHDLRNGFILDRLPILGLSVYDDENDEALMQYTDEDGKDHMAYGLEVLDPNTHKKLNRTTKEKRLDEIRERVRQARRSLEERLVEARRSVKEEVSARFNKIRQLCKSKEDKRKSEHGRVRVIVPGLNCDCGQPGCSNEIND